MRLKLRRPASLPSVRRIALAVALAATGATAVPAETLADAIALAYAHNPSLNRQRFLQQARDENYVQARSQYGPTLSTQVSGTYNQQSQAGFSLNGDNNTASVTLSQPLYTGGRLRGALESARANVLAGQETVRSAEQNTVQDVIATYAAVIRDEARLKVGRENVAVLRDQLAENRARRRVGDVTLTDVGQADARLAAGESQLASLEAALAISRSQYLQIVGQNPGTLAPLPDLAAIPASIDEAFRIAEDNNPDLGITRYTEQAASANVASVRGQLGPSVSANVQALYTNRIFQVDGVTGRKQVQATVTLSQPLFASGAIRSRVRAADAQDLAAQAAIDVQRRVILQDVTQNWSQLAAARIGLTSGQRQVESAQLAFAGMVREQRAGTRSTIEVLNTEQELQAAQLALLQARYNEYVSHASLLQAMGALEAKSLAPDIEINDPETHFRKVRSRGMTPLEPVVMAIDRIGSSAVRRPLSAELTGADGPVPDTTIVQPLPVDRSVTDAPFVPITQSVLVPENSAIGRRVAGDAPRQPAGTAQ